MLKKFLFAAVMLVLATPAFASHCPKDVAEIDALLDKIEANERPDIQLSDEQLAEVVALRDEGEELHKEGKHEESVEVLHQALEILGIKH